MSRLLSIFLGRTGLGSIPVRIRHGYLQGARWTLWPYSSYWRVVYEPEVQAALARHRPAPGSAAWDLGAHFGFYSLWLARAVGSTGEVLAVEPDPVSFARLQRHVALNAGFPVRSVACAASDCDGMLNLIQSQGAGATTSHLAYASEKPTGSPTVAIRTIRLDTLVASERLRPPVLIKIDVEGHAAAALVGASETLRRHLPRLLISLHSPEECTGVRDQLAPLGYRPTDLTDQPISWEHTLFQTAWFHVAR